MENTVQDIKQTIMIEAPIQKVWDKVSTAEGIEAWFMPNNFRLEVGHEFHLKSPFGPSPCKVIEIDAPHRFSFTWDTDGWVVSFILKELGTKRSLHSYMAVEKHPDMILPKPKEKSSIIRDRMNQGWEGITEKLRKVVEN